MFDASLVISVYDKTRELDLIFHALLNQDLNMKRIEVIIAEDGMNKDIASLSGKWSAEGTLNIEHITQEDKGFRKNRILNKAVTASSSPYIIFIDGDCIPHPEFVSAHLNNAEPNTVLCGRRVNLTRKRSEEMTSSEIASGKYARSRFSDIVHSALNKQKPGYEHNAEEGIIIRQEGLRKLLMNEDEHILGCNFSVHKQMLLNINGFDENYEGPGLGEDSDVEYRLRLTGARFRSVRNLAIVYHMYHPKTIEQPRNMEYFLGVKSRNISYCSNGIQKT
ncbi:MAG: glycosyltransferase [Ignavibacteria bacterium]|nr:glycosyltransferase [Ignavibacteria bacterium]